MKIKTFKVEQEKEINDFIATVDLIEQGGVQVLDNGTLVIFYKGTKEEYNTNYLKARIEALHRNLFHEEVLEQSELVELKLAEEKAGDFDKKSPEQKRVVEVQKRLDTINNNKEAFRRKLDEYTKQLNK